MHSHIHIPTRRPVNFTVLTHGERSRWQEIDGAGGMKVRGWKRKVAEGKPAGEEKGNLPFLFVTSGRSSCLHFVGFGGFWRAFSLSSGFGFFSFWVWAGMEVCLKVTECVFSRWRDGREEGEAEGGQKPSRSIAEKHASSPISKTKNPFG